MGQGYGIKCASCRYSLSVTLGIGMMYSPNAVFFGRSNDRTQNWSVAFPDGYCEEGKPLLLSLVKDDRIKNAAFELLKSGANPEGYGHELYFCPKCMRLENLFYFKLESPSKKYEPDYKCAHCDTELRRVESKCGDDGVIELAYKNHQKADWKCPDCNGDRLIDNGEMIMWD